MTRAQGILLVVLVFGAAGAGGAIAEAVSALDRALERACRWDLLTPICRDDQSFRGWWILEERPDGWIVGHALVQGRFGWIDRARFLDVADPVESLDPERLRR